VCLALYLWFARRGWSVWLYVLLVCVPLVAGSTVYRGVVSITQGATYLTDSYMTLLYSKPYARAPPFVIGLVTGCVLAQRTKPLSSPVLRWALHVGMLACFAICIVPLYYIEVSPLSDSYAVLNYAYVILFPVFWGLALSWFSIAAFDRTLPGQTYFEMSFFSPLAKLGLSVYLVHPIILLVRIFNWYRLPTYSIAQVVSDWLSCLVLSFCAAFAAFLVIEHPCSTLVKAIMPNVKK
jgi:hypothetical protein